MKQIEFPARLIFHKLCWEFLFSNCFSPFYRISLKNKNRFQRIFHIACDCFVLRNPAFLPIFALVLFQISKRKKTFAADSFRLHRSFFRHFCKRACINKLATRCNDQSDSVKLQQRLLRPARHLQHNRHLPFVHGIRIPCH